MGLFDRPGLLTRGVTDEQTEESTQPLSTDDGDHERFSHYVRKEKIVESAVTGKPVRALCGKKWVPNRDPEKFPICPTCKEIYATLKKE
ncbi:MAG: DUF3039 domain-containing protein [Actinomycetes bacterium]|jgi:hypothetical protein